MRGSFPSVPHRHRQGRAVEIRQCSDHELRYGRHAGAVEQRSDQSREGCLRPGFKNHGDRRRIGLSMPKGKRSLVGAGFGTRLCKRARYHVVHIRGRHQNATGKRLERQRQGKGILARRARCKLQAFHDRDRSGRRRRAPHQHASRPGLPRQILSCTDLPISYRKRWKFIKKSELRL